MAKIKYENIALRTKAVALIGKINTIVEDYQRQGYSLTLRQLYYQLVAHDFFPDEQKFSLVSGKWVRDLEHGTKNANPNYDWLGVTVSNGRRAGLIDWDAIVDRTRFLRSPSTWETPGAIVGSCANQFQVDRWRDQKSYVELWFEKDALLGIFERASEFGQLPIFSNRGYVSDSSIWEAAQRIIGKTQEGRRGYILHFGDHDPSGLDMTRDVEARLALFGAAPRVKRLALNMDQVRKYNPPPNPAKETDCRFADYQRLYGDESWELDALAPDVMVKLVEREIKKHIDKKKWAAALKRETEGRGQLTKIAENWDKTSAFADKLK